MRGGEQGKPIGSMGTLVNQGMFCLEECLLLSIGPDLTQAKLPVFQERQRIFTLMEKKNLSVINSQRVCQGLLSDMAPVEMDTPGGRRFAILLNMTMWAAIPAPGQVELDGPHGPVHGL